MKTLCKISIFDHAKMSSNTDQISEEEPAPKQGKEPKQAAKPALKIGKGGKGKK